MGFRGGRGGGVKSMGGWRQVTVDTAAIAPPCPEARALNPTNQPCPAPPFRRIATAALGSVAAADTCADIYEPLKLVRLVRGEEVMLG